MKKGGEPEKAIEPQPDDVAAAQEYFAVLTQDAVAFFEAPGKDPRFGEALRTILDSMDEDKKKTLLQAAREGEGALLKALQTQRGIIEAGLIQQAREQRQNMAPTKPQDRRKENTPPIQADNR